MQDRNHETYVYDHTPARRTLEAADPDEGPWPIHGVAVAAGDVLHDQDGNPVLITAEELEKAKYSKASQKLTKDHPDYDPAIEPPPVDATVGNNSMTYSDDGEAVVYDATTHDEDIAAGVNGETYGVSIHAGFRAGDPDPETGLPVAEDIVFHDTSIVTLGDSPSNTAQYGGRSDVAAWARSGGLEAAISEGSVEAATDDDDAESLIRRLATRFGILSSGDGRGWIRFDDQTSDGEMVTVREAEFRDAPWLVSIHRDGDEFDVGDGLGPKLGTGEPHEAGENAFDEAVELNEPLEEDETLFAVLRYHADGEPSDPITSSDGAHFIESAFVGVAPDGVEIEAEQTSDEGPDSPPSTGSDADDTTAADPDMTNRDDHIQFITANSHFDEEVLADMDDEELEQTRDLVDDEDEDGDGDDESDGQTNADTLGDMTVDELGVALRDRGFVTEDAVGEAVEASRSAATKGEQVDEIIAESEDYGEDDREELMASSATVVEKIHDSETTPGAAQIPGVGGSRRRAQAAVGGDSEYDLDDYRTGGED